MKTIYMVDLFCGEGGAAEGYRQAADDLGIKLHITGVDTDRARLSRYRGNHSVQMDAIEFLVKYGGRFDLAHLSPTCTGYSRGTAAIPDRVARYPRQIAAARAALPRGMPYVLENVADARAELRHPNLLCGRMFGLEAEDEDGTRLVLDRHRLFESNVLLMVPEHPRHDRSLQVAGSYGGARRDKDEARNVRKGGYVPSADVQRTLLGVPWMSEKGCQLSIPPAYTRQIGLSFLRVVL